VAGQERGGEALDLLRRAGLVDRREGSHGSYPVADFEHFAYLTVVSFPGFQLGGLPGGAIHLRWGMRLGPFGLNRLPNLHLERFLGQCPVAGD